MPLPGLGWDDRHVTRAAALSEVDFRGEDALSDSLWQVL